VVPPAQHQQVQELFGAELRGEPAPECVVDVVVGVECVGGVEEETVRSSAPPLTAIG
jgi:hypothetical protein